MRQNDGLILIDLLRLHDDTQLTSCLNGIAAGHAWEGFRNIFELRESLDIVFQCLSAGTRTGSGDRISRSDQYRLDTSRLCIPMMGSNGIDDLRRFMIFLSELHAEFYMRPLLFPIDSLAYIMKQPRSSGKLYIGSHFSRQNAGEIGGINAVLQDILPIAGTILQTAKRLDQFRIHTADAAFHDSLFTGFTDRLIHFFLRLCHDLFDAGRMDTAILDKTFQRKTRDFTADRIKARQDDSFRSIINDEIDAGQRFDGTDISAFTTNDASLHLFIRKSHDGNCGL